MFAFALWDRRRRRLLVARDRVGKKPLFYAPARRRRSRSPPSCRRCSQDQAIPRDVDHAALDAYLTYGYVPAPAQRSARACASCRRRTRSSGSDGRIDDRALLARSTTRPSSSDADVPELRERIREGLRRRHAQAADRRRAARRLPVRRDRLARRSSAAMAQRTRATRSRRSRSASTHDGLQRAAARAPGRRAVRHRAPRVRRPARTRSRSCRSSSATTASRSPTRRRSRASTSPS